MHTDEVSHRLLRMIQQRPGLTQREAAVELGVSLGRINYCLKALVGQGYVKLGNFRRSTNKRKYGYLLTHAGLEEKARITLRFLRRKLDEYECLKREIELLASEVADSTSVSVPDKQGL
jgi:EPS-associated MarR family transcriptional regulator